MIALATATAALILGAIALALVVLPTLGARREYQSGWLPTRPPGPLACLARRVFGLHVRRPSPDITGIQRGQRARTPNRRYPA